MELNNIFNYYMHGVKVEPNSKFCMGCGNQLYDDEEPVNE